MIAEIRIQVDRLPHILTLEKTATAMDAIKKKLVALREETDRAVAKANAAEEAANAANQRAEETEEKQRKLQKKLSEKENRLEVLMEDLLQAEIKAEEKEKLFHVAEQDIKQSERTIILKEAEVYRYTVGGFTTSTHFDDSIAGFTLERFMSLSKSKCELKEA